MVKSYSLTYNNHFNLFNKIRIHQTNNHIISIFQYFRLYAIRSWYSEEKDFTYGAKSQVDPDILI